MNRAVTAYLVALHLALALLVAKGDFPYRIGLRLGLVEARDSPFVGEMQNVHKRTDPHVPAGAVIFFGDSITQSLTASSVAPLAVNYGISGQRSDQLLRSMKGYASMSRASAVVVMIGTNDLHQGREQGLEERYRAILAKVPAGVPVVLSGIPPMAGKDSSPLVEAARHACSAHPRCRFVDAGITPDMLADGVHLGAEGYAVWAAALRQALATPNLDHRVAERG